MILTKEEADSLVEVRHRSPHEFLGMHIAGRWLGRGGARLFSRAPPKSKSLPSMKKTSPASICNKSGPASLKGPPRSQSGLCLRRAHHRARRHENVRRAIPIPFCPPSGETDLYLFGQGNERRIYDKLGAHLRDHRWREGHQLRGLGAVRPARQRGGRFQRLGRPLSRRCARWARRAFGRFSFPAWAKARITNIEIKTRTGALTLKTDPYGFFFEVAPKNASIVWNNDKFNWDDEAWLEKRRDARPVPQPDEHLRSASGLVDEEEQIRIVELSRMAEPLAAYVQNMGFTHVEFMPVAEHAFYPSWGYQVTGFYAPTSRFGTPDDFQFLVNHLHQAGIGVLVDWVPAHFPRDDWALARFDGTALYEHEDPRKGAHQDWGTLDFQLRPPRSAQFPGRQRPLLVRPISY